MILTGISLKVLVLILCSYLIVFIVCDIFFFCLIILWFSWTMIVFVVFTVLWKNGV